jgi:rhodanese-related sulfurtransferase
MSNEPIQRRQQRDVTIFDSAKTFIFYCVSGGRSALAAQRAQEMGLERVAHMGGGLKAWKEAGHPLDPYQGITGE